MGASLRPERGARSLLDAWEAVREGRPLEAKAREAPALAEALAFFGGAT